MKNQENWKSRSQAKGSKAHVHPEPEGRVRESVGEQQEGTEGRVRLRLKLGGRRWGDPQHEEMLGSHGRKGEERPRRKKRQAGMQRNGSQEQKGKWKVKHDQTEVVSEESDERQEMSPQVGGRSKLRVQGTGGQMCRTQRWSRRA